MGNPQQPQQQWSAAVVDSTMALLACSQRFPLVTSCTAGFTGLLIVSDMSENGCGKWGVRAQCGPEDREMRRPAVNCGCFSAAQENQITRAGPPRFFLSKGKKSQTVFAVGY